MSKTLVAYFSPTGTTARAARNLARLLGADVYEIRPAEPYTGADLNWTNKHAGDAGRVVPPAAGGPRGGYSGI